MPETTTSLIEQTSNVFDKVMNVNVKGVWLYMKYEISQMIKIGSGVIVNASSGAAVMGIPQQSIYSASKHVVLGMTKLAVLEYTKYGIRIMLLL